MSTYRELTMRYSATQLFRPARTALRVALALSVVLAAFVGLGAGRADAYVYWVNVSGNKLTSTDQTIGRADLDGSHVNTSFIAGIVPPAALAVASIAVDAGHIYWLWEGSPEGPQATEGIGRANLDGSGVNPSLVTWKVQRYDGAEVGLAVDAQHLYFTGLPSGLPVGCSSSPSSCGVIGRVNLDGSELDLSFISGEHLSSAGPVSVEGPYIYWYAGNSIGRANLDGSAADNHFVAGTGGGPTLGMAVNSAYIYWSLATECGPFESESASTTIARVNLDGSAVNKSFVSIGHCGDAWVAVDSTHVYWTSGQSAIVRAGLDGTHVETLVNSHVAPLSLAVDSLGPSSASGPTNAGAKCLVPNLKGLTLGRARKALRGHHCKLGAVKRKKAKRARRNRVIGQSVRPGRKLVSGSKVGVTVGK